MIAPFLASTSVNLLKPENKGQLKLIKDFNSRKMNDFLIQRNIQVNLCSDMLTFGDSNKSFKLDGDISKKMTNYNFNFDHSNPQDRKKIR